MSSAVPRRRTQNPTSPFLNTRLVKNPIWSHSCCLPANRNCEGERGVGNQIEVERSPPIDNELPLVVLRYGPALCGALPQHQRQLRGNQRKVRSPGKGRTEISRGSISHLGSFLRACTVLSFKFGPFHAKTNQIHILAQLSRSFRTDRHLVYQPASALFRVSNESKLSTIFSRHFGKLQEICIFRPAPPGIRSMPELALSTV